MDRRQDAALFGSWLAFNICRLHADHPISVGESLEGRMLRVTLFVAD